MLQQILKEIERYATPGRGVRVGQHDAAVRPVVVADVHAEVCVQRHGLIRDAEQVAPDRVERIGDVRIQDGLVRTEERLEREREHVVRPVAEKHLRGLHAEASGQRGLEAPAVRVRVERERGRVERAQHLLHARRGRVGVLVGV